MRIGSKRDYAEAYYLHKIFTIRKLDARYYRPGYSWELSFWLNPFFLSVGLFGHFVMIRWLK